MIYSMGTAGGSFEMPDDWADAIRGEGWAAAGLDVEPGGAGGGLIGPSRCAARGAAQTAAKKKIEATPRANLRTSAILLEIIRLISSGLFPLIVRSNNIGA